MANPGLFSIYFRLFLILTSITVSISILKSVGGVLGIQTRGCQKVDADETMELWRPPLTNLKFYDTS